jgi:predicted O-methyltransferase YrrM
VPHAAADSSSEKPQFFLQGHLDAQSNEDAPQFIAHYVALAEKYRQEVTTQIEEHERFIMMQRNMKKSDRCKGRIGAVEGAMLYIMLREYKPMKTIEIGALCATSTRWILSAIHANRRGTLTTYDLFDWAPTYIKKGIPDLEHLWTFVQGDAIKKLSKTRFDADVLFMDAAHTNEFAIRYTHRLLKKAAAEISKPLPMFVHDIFSPFIIPGYRECQKNMSYVAFDEEVACIRQIVGKQPTEKKYLKRVPKEGEDFLYSEKQPSGEGFELFSWLARTGRSAGMVTFSIYAAPEVAKAVGQAMGLPPTSPANNPSIFFQLVPDTFNFFV